MAMSMRIHALAARISFTVIFGWFTTYSWAALVVDPPLPISHQVEVQIIQTSLDNGLLPATVLGNATQRADIESGIDQIWAQAGIDIEFLPTITPYANTFAFQGAVLPRPTSDLSAIINNARNAGKLNPDPQVINMFFVEVPPGFNQLNQSTAAGIAMINSNGIAVFTGESLLTFANGRDVIAGVVGHEIGHNLGLNHTSSGGANLMAPNGTTEQLTSQQIETVLRSGFLQEVSMAGDFTGDGVVNGADLTVWRNAYGVNGNGDGDGDGDTDGRDYLLWQKTYGSGTLTAFVTVPEPATAVLLIACGFALCSKRGQTTSRQACSTTAVPLTEK